MNGAAKWIARWRVRLGYPLAIVVLFFARPNWKSILGGAAIGIVGLWLRACAAGYLKKQEVLTTTGPYAFTRNPLYLGSAVLAAGAVWAMHSWISACVLGAYFAIVYYIVMRREEGELRGHFGEHVNRSVLVGAENFYVCVAQAIEEFFARMAVRVLRSGGNNREFRVDGGEKLGRRRIFTAMMADLQDVRIEGLTGALRKYGR